MKCSSRQEFDTKLATAELPITLELETAPALYRHQDALQMYSAGLQEKFVHVFTVMPTVLNRELDIPLAPPTLLGTVQGLATSAPELNYEDTLDTAGRAMSVLQSFRAQGVAVALTSIETIIVQPPNSHQNSTLFGFLGAAHGSSNDGVYSSVIPSNGTLLRAVRVWFNFNEAITFKVDISDGSAAETLINAIDVVRNGSDGSWIVIKCISALSEWVQSGGMILGRPYLLTHVNGFDLSAAGYRSVQPQVPRGDGTWEQSVLPFFSRKHIQFTLA